MVSLSASSRFFRIQLLTRDEQKNDGRGDEQLLEASLLPYPEDEPANGETHDDSEDSGDGDSLGLWTTKHRPRPSKKGCVE